MAPGLLQQNLGAENIGPDEDLRPVDGAVHVGLGGKMDHRVDLLLAEQPRHQRRIADISLDEAIAGIVLHPFQVLQVARIGEDIQVDDTALGLGRQEMVDEVGADETGAAGDEHRTGYEQISHDFSFDVGMRQ